MMATPLPMMATPLPMMATPLPMMAMQELKLCSLRHSNATSTMKSNTLVLSLFLSDWREGGREEEGGRKEGREEEGGRKGGGREKEGERKGGRREGEGGRKGGGGGYKVVHRLGVVFLTTHISVAVR